MLHRLLFASIHKNKLIYNTCWEDPRLDIEALNIKNHDNIAMITSAGCNALNYLLEEPKSIQCIDMNYRQNALLALKIAGYHELTYEEFFQYFGVGGLNNPGDLYHKKLRKSLPFYAQKYWDKHIKYFESKGRRNSLYFHGTTGFFASIISLYFDRIAKVKDQLEMLFEASSIKEQEEIFENVLNKFVAKETLFKTIGSDYLLSLLGVPKPQRLQIDRYYLGGTAKFIEDGLKAVFCKIPIYDNYFWRVYFTGSYSKTCCPEYLKEENFEKIKSLTHKINLHTSTVTDFLKAHPEKISKFVLLDHMDWMSYHSKESLADEWQAIMDSATSDAKAIWRSGGLYVDFVDPIRVDLNNSKVRVGDVLEYDDDLARELHKRDRVQTYGSFYIANIYGSNSPTIQ